MTKRYTQIRIPITIHNKLKIKKIKMQERIKKITGKQSNLSYAKIIDLSVSKPIYLYDEELVNLKSKKGGRR